jgi:hypothetical protein
VGKIFWCGPTREQSGWGEASRAYCTALHAAGADVACRPFLFNSPVPELNPLLAGLEQKDPSGAEVVVQHLPPHLMEPSSKRTYGAFAYESSHFRNSDWRRKLNLLDGVIVFCEANRQACLESGVRVPVHVVPHAVNVERYCRSVPVLERVKPLKDEGLFLFYTLGEMVARKNLSSLILAFFLEFEASEPVGLVVKTSRGGAPADRLGAEVGEYCDQVRAQSGIKKRFRRELILTERLTDVGVLALHQSCDCFVQTSFSEAWSYPAFDAMGMGKTPIVPDWGGYREYVTQDTGWPVPCRPGRAYGLDDNGWGTMTADEEVGVVDIPALRRAMRQCYESKDEREEKSANGIVRAMDFAHERVGAQLIAALGAGP